MVKKVVVRKGVAKKPLARFLRAAEMIVLSAAKGLALASTTAAFVVGWRGASDPNELAALVASAVVTFLTAVVIQWHLMADEEDAP